MFSIWCEYDIGQENVIFKDKEVARKWARKQLVYWEVQESLEELESEDLVGYNWVLVINE